MLCKLGGEEMRKHISNEKKLNLILEYINEKGTKPIYSSEYKGYSVGVYLSLRLLIIYYLSDLRKSLLARRTYIGREFTIL